MRKTRSSIATLILSMVLFASLANARGRGGGGGGFWEKMSGPGLWKGGSGFYSICIDDRPYCQLDTTDYWLNFSVSFMTAGPEESEELQSPSLRAISFEPSLDYRLVKKSRPVYVGFGGGIHRFSGTGVGFTRVSFEPRASWVFWRPGRRAYFELRYAFKIFFQGFTAADFGNPEGRFTTNGTDTLHTLGVVVGLN